MNKPKPEDVMRALDILDKMDFFQGQRAGRELWNEKPYEVQEQDIADFSQGISTVKKVIEDASALLREKDVLIEALTIKSEDLEAELIQSYELFKENDAEIERLQKICHSYALQYGTVMDKGNVLERARFETISEVVERLKLAGNELVNKYCVHTHEGRVIKLYDWIDYVAEKLTRGLKYQERVSTVGDLRSLYESLKKMPTIKQYRGYSETKSYGFDDDGNPISKEGEVWFDNPFFY